MERVNIGEFRSRMLFWLNNLPIELARDGKVIAAIVPDGYLYKENGQVVQVTCTSDDKPLSNTIVNGTQTETLETLRAATAAIINKEVDKSTGEIKAEVRTFIQQADIDNEEVIFTGMFTDFVKKLGKQKAGQAWKSAKVVT